MGVQNFNLAAVKEYVDANNLSYEIYTEYLNSYGELILFPKTHIGIELTPNAWFWWYSEQKIDTSKSGFSYIYGGDLFLFFRQRYNRNTGGVIKAFTTGYNAEKKIQKFLKK